MIPRLSPLFLRSLWELCFESMIDHVPLQGTANLLPHLRLSPCTLKTLSLLVFFSSASLCLHLTGTSSSSALQIWVAGTRPSISSWSIHTAETSSAPWLLIPSVHLNLYSPTEIYMPSFCLQLWPLAWHLICLFCVSTLKSKRHLTLVSKSLANPQTYSSPSQQMANPFS
jgi:hypothetical protein